MHIFDKRKIDNMDKMSRKLEFATHHCVEFATDEDYPPGQWAHHWVGLG
jgi:hypothetical protein